MRKPDKRLRVKISPEEISRRLDVANAVLSLLAHGTRLERTDHGFVVSWPSVFSNPRSSRISRRWMTRGQDFYPVWKQRWGHGGTCCVALANLIIWCRGHTPLPLTTWKYWTGDTVRLGREHGPDILRLLADGGYPEICNCCLCGTALTTALDWWSVNGVVGPCCRHTTGCRQQLASDKS